MKIIKFAASGLFMMLLISSFLSKDLYAHCDGIKGPVVISAKKALETGNVNYALIWVSKYNEEAIKNLFQKSVEVRKLSTDARELADMYFFETLVRLHRNGEGEPYEGLKITDKDVPPVIHAADLAIETGNKNELLKYFSKGQDKKEIENRLKEVLSKKHFDINDLEAGRSYVKAYTEFVHYAADLSGSNEHEGHESKRYKIHG